MILGTALAGLRRADWRTITLGAPSLSGGRVSIGVMES